MTIPRTLAAATALAFLAACTAASTGTAAPDAGSANAGQLGSGAFTQRPPEEPRASLNPAFGSGAGLVQPPSDDSASGQLGSGN